MASAPIHHGEVLQGAFPRGPGLVRGLVTLPCAMYSVRAAFTPDASGEVTVVPAWKSKARTAAGLALVALDLPGGGRLELSGDVPLGRGFGSSTSDVLAAINAVGNAFRVTPTPEEAAKVAVQAEIASDSLMFGDRAVLFAQREGEVIEDFGAPLPQLRILGFGSRPSHDGTAGRGLDTLALPPARYTRRETERFAELRAMLREAIATKDLPLLGEVATASTRINQRHLPIPALDRILGIVDEVGAAGLQTAHSGDISGIILDRDDPEVDACTEHAQRALRAIGIVEQWKFNTDD
ncbi:kinase [Streptomyces sp. NPDC050504]|uniref:GHMP family kinase ATP-binding protein n=1 Tax=Streptomyces sp. NPDC050504 TaxID=3365618 RepID=UPI0037BBD634